ncbi:MAG TPA: hypothetical protein VLA89_06485 [Gemmatimonadales bacterium]|nr:hypothetical protein [Gemmatimonadales bacterium]
MATTPIEAIRGVSGQNLAAAPTVVVFGESSSAHSGTYFQFNGAGNLEILLPGVYNLSWASRTWALTGNKICAALLDVNVVSGSAGSWFTGQLTTGGLFAIIPLLLPDIIAGVDTTFSPSQDGNVIVGWDSLDTFPVEIETEYEYTEDGVSTAQTLANFAIGCVRLGDIYE